MYADTRLRRLAPRDLQQVAAVETACYPPEHRRGLAKHREMMAVPHVKGQNLSLGAFIGERLVGYSLMYVGPSEFSPGENVVWWMYLAVLPPYRFSVTPKLIRQAIGEVWRCGYHIEGHFRESTAFGLLMSHPKVIERLGGRITAIGTGKTYSGEHMIPTRLEWNLSATRTRRAFYWIFTRLERLRRAVPMLPLRTLRHLCYRLPRRLVPELILRSTYLVVE